MKKSIIVLLVLLTAPVLGYSQSEQNPDSLIIQGKKQLQTAVNRWTEPLLINARAYFERILSGNPNSYLIHYYIGLADYRLTSFCFSINDKGRAKRYIEDGINHLKTSIEANENFAEAHSLLSSLYGNKIAINPFLGITLGPKSGIEMGKAMNVDPKNPRNYLIAGISAYFTPKMFGGGIKKAQENLKQAIACFDSFKVENPTLPDWGHEEAYAWLGLVFVKNKEYEKAEESYKKALEINPDYNWVTNVLLPKLKKKRSEDK